jgi:tRNA(His) 5'-end guanylyltransferase
MNATKSQEHISGISNTKKLELLHTNGIIYDNLPSWQRFGIGMYFTNSTKEAFNPKTNEPTFCIRRVLHHENELPIGEEYSTLILDILNKNDNPDK